MPKAVILTVDEKTGEKTIEAEGFTRKDGRKCADATKAFEDALGTPGDKDWKPEAGKGGRATQSETA